MSIALRRRLMSLIAVTGVLASAGGCVAAVTLSHSGAALSLAGSKQRRVPLSAAASSSPVLAAPTRTFSAAPISAASPASGSLNQALAAAAAKPPPVIDGVRRSNVGAAHSPQLSRALGRGPATGALPASAGARGIDVASYQHQRGAAINWAQVAQAGYKFAFIKVSEGNYYVNPYYASDLAQAEAAGLYVTGYHFAVPNVSSGASQAQYAERSARDAAGGRTMPLALDIEYNPYGKMCYGLTAARMIAWISAFTAEARRLTGQLPIIYTTADWWRTCTADSTAFGSDPLWIAAWGPSPAPLPSGWPDWTFWQYTSRARVPGIDGNVDVSYFGSAAVRLLDPGPQLTAAGSAVRLQVSWLAAAGQRPAFTATGLPRGLSISRRGVITGTIAASAVGAHAVIITGRTPSGGTGSVSFTWTVTRPPSPAPSPTPPPGSPSPSSTSPTGPPPSPSAPVPASSSEPPAPSPSSPSSAGSSPSPSGSAAGGSTLTPAAAVVRG